MAKRTTPWQTLILSFGLTLALAACEPGPPPASNPAPTATMPPVTLQDVAMPTATPATPQGEVVTLGFDVRGWT